MKSLMDKYAEWSWMIFYTTGLLNMLYFSAFLTLPSIQF